ncbi:DNA repair protein RecN [Lentisalinibacter salinarum]|uniref:DNA repair protein RecN n=1 Tax=Lentisalinibacter salinarum TaxID=2992239 RepID=UPI003867B753
MLKRIHIRNFAIIDEIELDLGAGMTALTGETGAGKSILIDALGLILGDRGSAEVVRQGAKRAEISAEFEIDGMAEVETWLEEQSLDLDGECLLRRVIGGDGRSRAYINGNAVPVQNLRAIGEHLVDIHGQHEHQSLARREAQRDLLDHHGGHQNLREELGDAWRRWQRLADELDDLRTRRSERDSRLEFLRFQVDELEALALGPEELAELEAERRRLANMSRLAEGSAAALGALYENDEVSAQSLVAESVRRLEELAELDPALEGAARLAVEAEAAISEAAEEIRRYTGSLESDPGRHDEVETRLGAIRDVARKHRVEAGELPSQLERLQAELTELEEADVRLESLERDAAAAREKYDGLAAELTAARRRTAGDFSEQVTAAMQTLSMSGGRFVVAVETPADAEPREHGADRVEFLVSANPGQEPMSLARVASGGELSRISLAIQVVAAGASTIPSMVFDEVDSGIGGGVAEIVGRRLRQLGDQRQVLCVTHLPQVASQAHRHLRVAKVTDGKSTRTGITPLGDKERVEEIARMLGGVEITERTREHAAEMLAEAAGGRERSA